MKQNKNSIFPSQTLRLAFTNMDIPDCFEIDKNTFISWQVKDKLPKISLKHLKSEIQSKIAYTISGKSTQAFIALDNDCVIAPFITSNGSHVVCAITKDEYEVFQCLIE